MFDASFARGAHVLLLVVTLAACGGGGGGSDGPTTPSKPSTPSTPATPAVTVASVRVTSTATGLMVGMQATVTATPLDANGSAISGRTVTWSSEAQSVATVSAQGAVQAVGAGNTGIVATVDGKTGRVALDVVAKPDCADAALTLALGEVRVLSAAQRTSVCVTGGAAGGAYTLIPLSQSQVPSSRTQVEVLGSGLLSGGPTTLAARAAGAASLGAAPLGRTDVARHIANLSYDRGAATPSPRLVADGRRALLGAAVKIGDNLPLYANGSAALDKRCTTRPLVPSRVVGVGVHSVVVADTLNPPNGFTPAEYQQVAEDFDRLVYPVDSANFAPTLAAASIIFFTREVNRETPPGAPNGSTLGYFWPADLYQDPQCPRSNGYQMFYVRVPDPAGTINQNTVSKAEVKTELLGTLVHELQHLIGEEQRSIVKRVPDQEPWLNEGLSTIAEELLFYKLSGLAPRQALGAHAITQTQALADAFNGTIGTEFPNLAGYLSAPETNMFFHGTPFPTQSYGAAWQFLRFAADRSSRDESSLWRSLQIAPTTGLASVNAILGDPTALTRDFAAAQVLSDAGVPVDATHRFASWNYLDIYTNAYRLGRYPLNVTAVTGAAARTLTLAGGGTAYLRLDVPAGGIGAAKITSQSQPLPASVDLLLVRTR